MKRLAVILIVLFIASTVFAGGKECEMRAAKSVELTGTLAKSTDGATTVFRVANSDKSYVICHQTKASVLKLGSDANTTLQIKGKLVSCDESKGEELVITEAKKV